MTDDEVMRLNRDERVVVLYAGREIPGTVSEDPGQIDGCTAVHVILDAGLGYAGPGEPIPFAAHEIVRRSEPGEGLVRIGCQVFRQAATIFAEGE